MHLVSAEPFLWVDEDAKNEETLKRKWKKIVAHLNIGEEGKENYELLMVKERNNAGLLKKRKSTAGCLMAENQNNLE